MGKHWYDSENFWGLFYGTNLFIYLFIYKDAKHEDNGEQNPYDPPQKKKIFQEWFSWNGNVLAGNAHAWLFKHFEQFLSAPQEIINQIEFIIALLHFMQHTLKSQKSNLNLVFLPFFINFINQLRALSQIK